MSWLTPRNRGGWGPSEGDDESPTRWGLTTVIRTILDVVPGGVIRAGKTAYTDDATVGFWLGVDSDGYGKLNIGSASYYLKWTGTRSQFVNWGSIGL